MLIKDLGLINNHGFYNISAYVLAENVESMCRKVALEMLPICESIHKGFLSDLNGITKSLEKLQDIIKH
jgi:dihydroorotate dehydrogenase